MKIHYKELILLTIKRCKMARIIILFILATLFSCSQQSAGNAENEFSGDSANASNQQVFLIPSPAETFQLLATEQLELKPIEGNDPENVSKYQTFASRAINLGIYSTDATYAALTKQSIKLGGYFKSIKILLDQLNMTSTLDKNLLDKIEQNLEHSDSMYAISMVLYEKMNVALDSDANRKMQVFLMFGGWLEGMYLSTNLVEKYDNKNALIARISEQDIVLDNILGAIETLTLEEDTDSLASWVMDANNILQSRYEQENGVIDEVNFNAFKLKISEIRTKIVNN